MTWTTALAPLRNRNFAWYFASRFVNTLGNMMASIALAFAVLDITDSPAALGQVLAAHTIPMIALLLYGGVIADRFPRTLVLQFSNVSSAVSQGAIAMLVLAGEAEIWMLVVLSIVHGAVSGVGFPAMASVLPQLVPREDLQPANALVSLTRNGMMVLGPTKTAGVRRDAEGEDRERSEEALQGERQREAPAPSRDEEPQPHEEVVEA